ncbi:MAG: DUF1983 domain-containing protein, partial [Methanoculleus sp.]|nr:DUF1983 domain-containing protein [Methanoculleus sp.]
MASKYPSIPSVPSDVSATTRAWMQAVTQALQSGTGAVRSADRFLKLSDIGRTITLDDDSSNSTLPYSGEATGDTPNPPTNFNVTATIYGSILSWEYPVNNADIVSHVEVWTNSINARSEASRVAIVTRPVAEYKDVWKSPYADHYYWIRCVSYGGKYSTWLPTDAMGGELVMGATSISKRIDDALDILQENLTKDQLATDLLAEINTIAVNTTSIATESSTRSSADSALASSIETVQTSVNNNTASIETANTSIDGIKAEHTVKVQVRSSDGKVVLAGIGMMADSESNQSEIIIMADKFQIVTPDTGEGTPKQPFVVGTVDGVSTIGIDGTLMVDGSVNTKAIATDNAFIGHTIQSANYSAGTAGWQINGATGLAEFNGITFRITDLKSAAGWDELP